MSRYDVVGLGWCTVDYSGLVQRYPALDTKIFVQDFAEGGGGPAANAMVTLARLGMKAAFIGKVGDDTRGNRILEDLKAEGVDVASVRVERGQSSQISLIIAEAITGKRTVVYSNGTVSPMKADELDKWLLGSCRLLHLDGHHIEAALEAAQYAAFHDLPILVDAGSKRDGIEELLGFADYIVTSAVFARACSGLPSIQKAAHDLFKRFRSRAKAVVVTDGEKGGHCVSAADAFTYRAFPVKTIDSTGAGDVFHGAFSYGILRDWDLRKTIRFAAAAAALSCRSLGARRGIPTLRSVTAFLRQQS